MKTLIVIALTIFTLNGVAQEKRKRGSERHDKMELRKEMTPEDIADLKSKKLTLRLDLTDTQQNEARKIILQQSKLNHDLRDEHKTNADKREKPSKDAFVKMQNHKLDQLISLKREMKTILTPEQYAKFEKMRPRKQRGKGKNSKRE